jgi:hypothetical protein
MRSTMVTETPSNYHNNNVNKYLTDSNMESNTVWATDAKITSASSLLSTDIYVYSTSGSNSNGVIHYDCLRYPEFFSLDTFTHSRIYLQILANDHLIVCVCVCILDFSCSFESYYCNVCSVTVYSDVQH